MEVSLNALLCSWSFVRRSTVLRDSGNGEGAMERGTSDLQRLEVTSYAPYTLRIHF